MRNFQGVVFYMKTNIKGDFQICISVPLKVNNFISVDFQTHVTISFLISMKIYTRTKIQ